MKTYSLIIIFPGMFGGEVLDKAQEKVNAEIVKHGGEIMACKVLGKRSFARPLHKHNSGIYVKMSLTMDPDQIAHLMSRFKLNEDVFRAQIVKLDTKGVEEKVVSEEVVKESEKKVEEAVANG